jgi:hypothetical protein
MPSGSISFKNRAVDAEISGVVDCSTSSNIIIIRVPYDSVVFKTRAIDAEISGVIDGSTTISIISTFDSVVFKTRAIDAEMSRVVDCSTPSWLVGACIAREIGVADGELPAFLVVDGSSKIFCAAVFQYYRVQGELSCIRIQAEEPPLLTSIAYCAITKDGHVANDRDLGSVVTAVEVHGEDDGA